MTVEVVEARRAESIGVVSHCVPAGELYQAVDAFCDRLAAGALRAIRWTKTTVNLELKRIAHALMDPGIAYEALSVHSDEHARAVAAFNGKRPPKTAGS